MLLQNLLGRDKLLRNMSLEQRVQYRKQKENQMQANKSKGGVIVIVQFRADLDIKYKCIVSPRNEEAHKLLEYMKKYTTSQHGTFYVPNKNVTVVPAKKIG